MARQPIDLTGRRFGRLTAERVDGTDNHGHRLWMCRCTCGGKIAVTTSHLRSGATTSCGCAKKEHGNSPENSLVLQNARGKRRAKSHRQNQNETRI